MSDNCEGGSNSITSWIWVLIPLFAIGSRSELSGALLGGAGIAFVLVGGAFGVRGIMKLRHQQKLELLNRQVELSKAETQKLAEINRTVLDPNVMGVFDD